MQSTQSVIKSKANNSTKHIALAQVFLLFFSIIAIAFILGSSIPSVSAAELGKECKGTYNNENVKGYCFTINQANSYLQKKSGDYSWVKLTSSNCISGAVCMHAILRDSSSQAKDNTDQNKGTSPQLSTLASNQGKLASKNVKKAISSVTNKITPNNPKGKVSSPLKSLALTGEDVGKGALEKLVLDKIKKILGVGKASKSASSTTGFSDFFTNLFTKASAFSSDSPLYFGNIMARLGAYAIVAAAADIVANQISRAFGSSPAQAAAIGNSVGAGVFSGLTATGIFGLGGLASAGIGFGVAAIYFLFAYKKEAGEVVKYQCLPYTAPTGGENCAACNNGPFPCTEYQCRSLGQECELFGSNNGTALCVAKNRNQVTPPQVSAWEKPLKDGFIYTPLTTNFPEDRGVKVVNKNDAKGCVKPFQSVSFGITLDQPGICKFDYNRTPSYDTMQNQFFNNGQPLMNSSLSFTFPDAKSMNDSGFSYNSLFNKIYVRCKNAAGNKDKANFVFQFCVDPAPDLAAPVILEASPLDNSPIAYNTSSVKATFYVNKPSSCKWANQNLAYNDMKNNMTCAQTIEEGTKTSTPSYPCTATLNSIVNYKTNDFYVRCKSYPGRNESERAEMTNAYKYSLISTRPLQISKVTPNQTTIKSSSAVIPVTITVNTLGGANNGIAYCSYKLNNLEKNLMVHTGKAQSTQNLNLDPGTYSLNISCADNAANTQTAHTTFTVYSDTLPPLVTRVYSQEDNLNIITDENSTCVSSKTSCNYQFEDGTAMQDISKTQHYTPWDTNSTLYIKCEDAYGNQPTPEGTCSIVVQPYSQK